jgi:hypothetical protein
LDRTQVQVAVLRIRDNEGLVDLEVAGRLCWNQQTGVASNTLGFHFRRDIPIEVINEMVDAGLVTRRQETRISSGIAVQVRRAYGMPNVARARLQDFSTTGIRLEVDTVLSVGERLLVCASRDESVSEPGPGRMVSGSVTVKWIRPQSKGFECGCIFQNLASSHAINDHFSVSMI